jgi:excisionase family DNA binding protein
MGIKQTMSKQRTNFVKAYVTNGERNATKAAIAAGYSNTGNGASVIACRLLQDPTIQEAILEEKDRRERLGIASAKEELLRSVKEDLIRDVLNSVVKEFTRVVKEEFSIENRRILGEIKKVLLATEMSGQQAALKESAPCTLTPSAVAPSREGRLTITVEEAALRLGISRPTAYEAVKIGSIPSIKIGHRILVPLDALDRMLNPVQQ